MTKEAEQRNTTFTEYKKLLEKQRKQYQAKYTIGHSNSGKGEQVLGQCFL